MNVEVNQLCAGFGSVTVVRDLFFFFCEMMVHARLSCKEGWRVIGEWAAAGRGGYSGSSQTMHARNSSKEPLRAFLFSSRASLKIETGLDRDPEIDRGHHSYKRHTIQEYSVCTV